ncbi:GPI inositol-deacylase [Winogradskyella vincentii]|uniref:GPI inositol-deacylase n=1 Tax=Winogradskyella vincentii TaxID=2877122 RepID=A0ABS7Y0N5_9FLAO|nr:GPI inositol-deacylase [Winogradskyella vincentii]MCA0153490.1 GPI inositol-deacylase [Winogradskyella vincentii]
MSNNKNTSSYLQGYTRLIADATIGITDLVETMHNRVVHPPFLPSTPIQHLITSIAGITYKNIRWSTKLISRSLDNGLGQLAPVLGKIKSTDKKEAISSALNGVVGDYLEEKENPLKITMQFRHMSEAIQLDSKSIDEAYPTINGKILLMVHGSCMNDIQWTRQEHNHGTSLAKDLGKTPIYLHYNSGRHISSNGKNLNELLEDLILHWTVPVEELVIIAHSMGGLVVRSALHYGQQQQKTWTKHLKKIVFLGTPHHGAPLERIGNYVDNILGAIPYAKPFARLGKVRSAGITDLRYGNLIDEDWQDNDRFEINGDQRQNIPLPQQIECYSIAAVTGKATNPISSAIIGDSLVDVKSALGQHKNPAKNLDFKDENTWVAYGNNHMDLLSNPKIYSKIKAWLD